MHDTWSRNPALTRMTFNRQDDSNITQHRVYDENYQACSDKSLLYCVIKAGPARPSVCLCLYFVFQSQAMWCNCSKGTIWYFGIFFFLGLDKFCASRSVWDGMAAHRERACSTRSWPQSFLAPYPWWKKNVEGEKKKRKETFTFSL